METSKLENEKQYVIVQKDTQELWNRAVYLSETGAKNSYYHANSRSKGSRKFDDQDKYEIVKVKLVRVND